ncbi:CU044_5270 family protein [Micromonospora sp. WMMD1120]|uniref:CU044_5270 family protein n=1 Tax=Micromonospora sp. WMMD1120 TaxID=3016106 RepID=UPI002417F542|nr:CU044_5270 family protein [Micromonospora sp. WMMD1120]MDG4808519.1 CU044_5270 family protein [Micromonospora sp. WMMD1120]
MNETELSPRGFEEQLLRDLTAHVAQRAEVVSVARPARRRTRLLGGWRLAGAFGLAVTLTVGALAVQTMRVGEQPPPTASASEIFRLAADAARQQPELTARPDQYVFTESLATFRELPASGPYRTIRNQLWQSAGGIAYTQGRYRPETDPNGWSELRVLRIDDPDDPEKELDAFQPPAYHGDLPTDPDELFRYLREHPVDLHLSEGADEEAVYGDESMAYTTARSMLRGYVPPRTLAALFEVLARQPGAVVISGDVVDAAGRHGVAIRMPGVIGGNMDLIFDRDSHVYLGTRGSVIRDGKESLYDAVAVLRIAIVDRPGQVP